MTEQRLAYKVTEAARLLQVSRTTMYEAVRRGPPDGVRVVRLGRAIRVPHSELLRLLEAKREDAAG